MLRTTKNAEMQTVLSLARRAASSEATVLVSGETGTGKEVLARLIHEASPRARGPFVRVNCAALAEGLLESELFGHEQGAFTGATRSRQGRFELARGGTLFLDEIGDVPPKVQVSLLRVLQEREFERVGGNSTIRVDARIVAATHRNLAQRVQDELFREDLYYRLNVVPIALPPLRERIDDIGPLVQHFVERHGAASTPRPTVGPGVVEHLMRHAWPGNVRELENLVLRALVLGKGPELTLDDFRVDEGAHAAPTPSPSSRLSVCSPRTEARRAEREDLRQLLLDHGGNVARAARAIGVARTTLVSRAKKHGLLDGALERPQLPM
jgi:two-component system response regulator HydG